MAQPAPSGDRERRRQAVIALITDNPELMCQLRATQADYERGIKGTPAHIVYEEAKARQARG